jgi:hypothetical protein
MTSTKYFRSLRIVCKARFNCAQFMIDSGWIVRLKNSQQMAKTADISRFRQQQKAATRKPKRQLDSQSVSKSKNPGRSAWNKLRVITAEKCQICREASAWSASGDYNLANGRSAKSPENNSPTINLPLKSKLVSHCTER